MEEPAQPFTNQADFGAIAGDFAFSIAHSTETGRQLAALRPRLAALMPPDRVLRLLDVGCGTGDFTAAVLDQAGWPPDRLRLALVEPVADQLHDAATRLAAFTDRPVAAWTAVPDGPDARFDLILANHVLYYVPDLDEMLASLHHALAPSGTLFIAMAGEQNPLIAIWRAAYLGLGVASPDYFTEDVTAALDWRGVPYRKETVPYGIAFPDSEENRLKILRFLLRDALERMPLAALLASFDAFRRGDRIEMASTCDHYFVGRDVVEGGSRPGFEHGGPESQ